MSKIPEMNDVIFKYPLHVVDEQPVLMPEGAAPLRCGFQGNDLFVWALVDPKGRKVNHTFWVEGTGHPIEHNGAYLDTAFDPRGFVWHVFYRGSR